MKLETAFWEMTIVTTECVELYDILKTYFRMCTNINNYVPVRPWFDDADREEQWGCGYRDDIITQFKQEISNKKFTLQDHGKDDPIDTLEKKTNSWINIISNAGGPVPDNFYDFDYSNEGLDHSVCGSWENRIRKIIGNTQM